MNATIINMETFKELNNENNSCMLINPDKNYLYKSFNILVPQNPVEIRNQRAKIGNKIQNSTDDTKFNANTNFNSSYQKTISICNESNCDSNSQTDRSSNNIKEIKVNLGIKEKKNIIYDDNNSNNKLVNITNLYDKNLDKILLLQKWWKHIYKIIVIQKYLRGFLFRRNMSNILYFIKCCYTLFFKLMINKIKRFVKENENNKIDVFKSTEMKDIKKIKKNELSHKFLKDKKLNNYPSFNRTNFFTTNQKIDEIKKNKNKKFKNEKFGTNNPINNPINVNINKSNDKLISIKPKV